MLFLRAWLFICCEFCLIFVLNMPIDYDSFIHPQDKAALDALKKVPFFDTALKMFMKVYDERVQHAINMASNIRLSRDQYPEIYASLVDICAKLGIEVPELYLKLDPNPNAWTYGETKPFIVITTGLRDLLTSREIYAALAHECGHIICHHVLYKTVAARLMQLGTSIFGIAAKFAQPLVWAFQYWNRKSELSADRVAVYCLNETDSFVRMAMRFCGGGKENFSGRMVENFMKQAETYEKELNDSVYEQALQAVYIMDMGHPFMTVRCLEAVRWFKDNRNTLPKYANRGRLLWR